MKTSRSILDRLGRLVLSFQDAQDHRNRRLEPLERLFGAAVNETARPSRYLAPSTFRFRLSE